MNNKLAGKLSIFVMLFLAYGASVSLAIASCPGETQIEMNQCAANDYLSADHELGILYSKIDKSKELIAAERAWIAYRDAECAYQVKAVEGGSIAPMVKSLCLTELTKQRSKQLASDQQN